MFDPHRTRRSDSRYFTRKGQVIQASRVNTNPVIEQRLVPIYKNYIIKNGLFQQDNPSVLINRIMCDTYDPNPDIYVNISDMTLNTESTVNLTLSHSTSGYATAILIINEDTNGNIIFKTRAITSGSQTITIPNNVRCYSALVPITSTDFDFWTNGIRKLFHDDQMLFSIEGDDYSISSAVPVHI